MNYLKIVLAVLLLLCLLDMPYGFYILIRYVATVVFGYMAYSYYQENKKGSSEKWSDRQKIVAKKKKTTELIVYI